MSCRANWARIRARSRAAAARSRSQVDGWPSLASCGPQPTSHQPVRAGPLRRPTPQRCRRTRRRPPRATSANPTSSGKTRRPRRPSSGSTASSTASASAAGALASGAGPPATIVTPATYGFRTTPSSTPTARALRQSWPKRARLPSSSSACSAAPTRCSPMRGTSTACRRSSLGACGLTATWLPSRRACRRAIFVSWRRTRQPASPAFRSWTCWAGGSLTCRTTSCAWRRAPAGCARATRPKKPSRTASARCSNATRSMRWSAAACAASRRCRSARCPSGAASSAGSWMRWRRPGLTCW